MSLMRLLLRPSKRRLVFAGVVLALIFFYASHGDSSLRQPQTSVKDAVDTESYEILPVSGFTNTRIPDGPNCDDVRIDGQQLAVSKSVHLEDDLRQIVGNIDHPMIDYPKEVKDLSIAGKVKSSWARMAGSGVWLAKYNVYLLVSRVYFWTQAKNYARISFIRAQLYNEDWEHLDGHTISWHGKNMTFPRILDIPAPYMIGGYWYGPEDPRILIEPDDPDAEPVVVFNMITNATAYIRAMHIHRPFSNFTQELVIENEIPHTNEKNWAPFFMPVTDSMTSSGKRYESEYLYLTYDLSNLRILRCHLTSGRCQLIYAQTQADSKFDLYRSEHEYGIAGDDIRGGTNFIHASFDTRPGLTSFIGFPRTHIGTGCGKEALYRPVLMLLVTNGTHFFLDYVSQILDFGHAILNKAQYDDPCEEGRILIGSAIAKFDEHHDLMTITFTVADSTVQVANLRGVRLLLESLPQMQLQSASWQQDNMHWRLNVTHDVLECASVSGVEFALAHKVPEPVETPKQKAAEQKPELE